MKLLLNTKDQIHHKGETSLELAQACGRVKFDLTRRICYVFLYDPRWAKNPPHELLYGDSWGEEEMLLEMAQDAISYLCRNCGFELYSKD